MNNVRQSSSRLMLGALAFTACAILTQTAHADEFNGKLAGWLDVTSAPYGANGGDSADDAFAIQSAIDALGGAGKKVLYIPNGTYYLSKSLTMSGKAGVSILGQSRDGVKIIWRGAPGGTMMESQGNWFSRFGRMTWIGQDGTGQPKAGVIWWDWNKGETSGGVKAPGAGYAVTHNEHADEVFQDAGYGIRVGGRDVDAQYNQMDAETPVLRCKFKNLSVAGLSIEDPNALDWWVWYGDFQNCAQGVTNDANAQSKGGNFHVYYSKFAGSTVTDVGINNTSFFSLRGNYSTNSERFVVAKDQGTNAANLLLMSNTVLDCKTQPCLRIQNSGPLTLIDNKFRQLSTQTPSPMVAVGGGWPDPSVRTPNGSGTDDTISINNQFSAPNPIVNFGRLRSFGDSHNATGISGTPPTIPDELPFIPAGTGMGQRRLIEITAPGGTNDITSQLKTAITTAQSFAGQRPIIHIPDGNFEVSETIVIPANLDVQIVGDGFFFSTQVSWNGTGTGPVFRLDGPNKATLRDLHISGAGYTDAGGVVHPAVDGIWIGATNQSGERISMEQTNFATMLATGLPNTIVEMHDCYNGGSSTTALTVDNSHVNLYGGQFGANNLTFDVKNNGNFMAQDFWYETGANASAPAMPGFMNLTGSGSMTLQSFLTSPVTTATTSAINIDGFQGKINFLGMTGAPGYSSNPFKTVVTNQSTGALSMVVMGSASDTPTWFTNNSTSANIGFFTNKGGGQKLTDYRTGSATSDDAMINNALAQIRNELPRTWPLGAPSTGSGSDVRLFRVMVGGGATDIKVLYSNTTTPTPGTGNGTGLTAQYYNDLSLTSLAKTQVDPKVDFVWPNSPKNLDGTTMTGIGADNFSVRWSGQVQAIEAGNYTFQTSTDDGVRLWLTDTNGTPLINDWNSHGTTANTTPSTIALTAGQKINVKMEFFEEWGGAEAHFLWKRPGQTAFTIVPQTQLYPTMASTVGNGTGLTGRYYSDLNLTTLVKTQVDPKVDFVWPNSPKNLDDTTMSSVGPDNFSVRWSGQIQATEAGDYSFQTSTDDGVRLWLTDVNGTPLINDWNSHGTTVNTIPTTISLTAGQKINVKMEFFEEWGGAEAHLLWKRPGQTSFVIVPQAQLYPTPG